LPAQVAILAGRHRMRAGERKAGAQVVEAARGTPLGESRHGERHGERSCDEYETK
jgi:hypothetical protein